MNPFALQRKSIFLAKTCRGIVNVASFPYTLQASDNGKILNLNTVAESVVNVPTGLGASFRVTLTQTGDYPVTVTEVGTQVTTGSYRISHAYGLGSPMILGRNKSVTLTASSANVLTMAGSYAKWQAIADKTSYPDAFAYTTRQYMTRTFHHAGTNSLSEPITGIKVGYIGAYSQSEFSINCVVTARAAFEYPLSSAPQQILFSGVQDGALTNGGILWSDFLLLTTPITASDLFAIRTHQRGGVSATVTITNASPGVVTHTAHGLVADSPISFATTGALPTGITAGSLYYTKTILDVDTYTISASRAGAVVNTSSAGSGTHTVTSGGLPTTKGKATDEYINYSVTTGTSLDLTMTATASYPANNPTLLGTGNGSPQCIRPFIIIGVTDSGAYALLGDSRSEPSNGDFPTVGGSRFSGDGERVWGRKGVLLNLAVSADALSLWSQSFTAIRRGMIKYTGTTYLNHLGINDCNVASATMLARYNAIATRVEFVGRTQYAGTLPPSTTSTNDFIDTANQTVSANEATRLDANAALRAGTVTGVTGYVDVAVHVESSGKWMVDAGAREIIDATATSGSNIIGSVTAVFTSADTGKLISGPWGASGATITAVMTYIDAVSVSLTARLTGLAFNASATATMIAGTARIRCKGYTMDGLHGSQYAGEQIEASVTLPF